MNRPLSQMPAMQDLQARAHSGLTEALTENPGSTFIVIALSPDGRSAAVVSNATIDATQRALKDSLWGLKKARRT